MNSFYCHSEASAEGTYRMVHPEESHSIIFVK